MGENMVKQMEFWIRKSYFSCFLSHNLFHLKSGNKFWYYEAQMK